MGKGLRVHVSSTQDGGTIDRVFEDAPVRIGRDPLNELRLDHPFVSKFHAVLDVRGDAILLRDLGSRNGTSLSTPTERIAPHDSIDLAKSDHAFSIGTLRIAVSLADVDPFAVDDRPRGGAILSSAPALDDAPRPVSTAAGLGGAPQPAGIDAVRGEIAAWRDAWGRAYARLSTTLASMPDRERARVVRDLAQEHPSLAAEPDFRRLAGHVGVSLDGVSPGGSREEAAALLVLRDLASWYVDADHPPQTAPQLVAFGRKVQDVLDALFVSFLPLRDGLKKLESELDVRATAATQGARRVVDGARTPAELAARLLDWKTPGDTGRAVRSFFADVMVHHVGLVNGVARGARAMLEQLAPETLERELDAERARGLSSLAVGPLRYRALWDVLKRRHDELTGEAEQRVSALFGDEFARAYEALADGVKTPEAAHAGPVDRAVATRTQPPNWRGPRGTVVVDEADLPPPPKKDAAR